MPRPMSATCHFRDFAVLVTGAWPFAARRARERDCAMGSRAVFGASKSRNRIPLLFDPQASRSFCRLPSTSVGPCFGIAFDIDGVILRGHVPIGGSSQALRRLYQNYGTLKVPFLFLTNGGGIPESRRADELSALLGVKILPSQVVQGHSPFKNLVSRFDNELIVATGKGEPALVMSEYGFKKVLSLDEYASYFENIDPVSQYKNWKRKHPLSLNNRQNRSMERQDISFDRVKAAFVVSDPVDWGRDIQVLCDILKSGGHVGKKESQPPLYFAADDLEYQAAFPTERLGMGAFRIALETVFNRIHHSPLQYTSYGKPNPAVFRNAEAILRQLETSCRGHGLVINGSYEPVPFKTLYMIGDNPLVDIKGARKAGGPWFSILTRTGVFKGEKNDEDFPADLVVDTVEEAVDYILTREHSL